MDGFGVNSGVASNGGRENPTGVRAVPSADLQLPTNVPLVMPANDTTKVEPSMSALSLAQALGNINFGALGRTLTQDAAARKKLADEQETAKGTADTAMLLSQTGSDYETLVRSGRIPSSASPAFQLGSSIAASQSELGRLRKEVMLRAQANPNAPVFTDDPDFMNQFYGRLSGVRDEAVVKYFLEPMRELAADDTKRYAKAADDTAKSQLTSDVVGAFEDSIQLGDAVGPALNNAINKLKLSNHKTPETTSQLIAAAGPKIVESAKDENGKVDLAKAGQLLDQIGSTKVTADGDRRLSFMYTDDFDKLSSYVYGTVNRAAAAEKVQYEAAQHDAQTKYIFWLDKNFSNVSPGEAVRAGVGMGLDAKTATELFGTWGSKPGNKSQEEITQTKAQADWTSAYDSMTPSDRKSERDFLNQAYHQGMVPPDEYVNRMKLLNAADHKDTTSAPISRDDRSVISSTLYGQMGSIFGTSRLMNQALFSATTGYRLEGSQTDVVRRKVADRLADVAMSWIIKQPGYTDYRNAVDDPANAKASPHQIIGQLTTSFLQTNLDQLQPLVTKALSSPNPDAALLSLKLKSTSRVYTNHSKPVATPRPVPTKRQPGLGNIHKLEREASVVHDSHETARAMGNILDAQSPIYQWYAMDVKSRNPKLTDTEVMQRVRALPPNAIRSLQKLYNKEHGL